MKLFTKRKNENYCLNFYFCPILFALVVFYSFFDKFVISLLHFIWKYIIIKPCQSSPFNRTLFTLYNPLLIIYTPLIEDSIWLPQMLSSFYFKQYKIYKACVLLLWINGIRNPHFQICICLLFCHTSRNKGCEMLSSVQLKRQL